LKIRLKGRKVAVSKLSYLLKGEEVTSFEHVPEAMITKAIPASIYAVFTMTRSPIPVITRERSQSTGE
jgi:predicted transcriptional regulator YdeE